MKVDLENLPVKVFTYPLACNLLYRRAAKIHLVVYENAIVLEFSMGHGCWPILWSSTFWVCKGG